MGHAVMMLTCAQSSSLYLHLLGQTPPAWRKFHLCLCSTRGLPAGLRTNLYDKKFFFRGALSLLVASFDRRAVRERIMCLPVPRHVIELVYLLRPRGTHWKGGGCIMCNGLNPVRPRKWCHPFSARARGLLGARLVTRYPNCASTRRCSCPSVILAWARIQSGFLGVLPQGRWCV